MNLYETLGILKDAELEQIRKAYRKKALQTHPDRLPQDATQEDKAASEEMFRKVNNAYEVLSDPQKRRAYDFHGVWPPPERQSTPHRSGSGRDYRAHSQHHYHTPHTRTFQDPPFDNIHPFSFSDPFCLFNSVFGMDSDSRRSFRQHRSPWMMQDPFERLEADLDDFLDGRQGGGLGPFGFPPMDMRFPSLLASSSFTDGGRWPSESDRTTTINGVTETIHKKRDRNGNEHVTRTYGDGRTIRTINGVEQPSSPHGYISHYPEEPYRTPSVSASQSRPRPWSTAPLGPPPPYPGHAPAGYGSTHVSSYGYTALNNMNDYSPQAALPIDHSRHQDYPYSEPCPVMPDPRLLTRTRGREERKRWWLG